MSSLELALSAHPLGVCPLGNAYLEGARNLRPKGLGCFAYWEDAFLVQFLIEWLDVRSLLALSSASRSFYALVNTPQVWREKYIRDKSGYVLKWNGSWRGTYAATETQKKACQDAATACRIHLSGVYSDTIYQEFITASFDPRLFIEMHARREMRKLSRVRKIATDKVPERPSIPDNIERLDARTCDVSKFLTKYSQQGQPCILMHATENWPCHAWSLDFIEKVWATRMFQAEALRVNGENYVSYARSVGGGGMPDPTSGVVPDTSPFYLFDADVAVEDAQAARDWRVPTLITRYPRSESLVDEEANDEQIRADLFCLFGNARPDYRWLIAGPKRSGSCWHKDPNMTSAWNAVMQGSKYWMLLPPKTVPPGVYVTEDESEVTAPASLSEWMLDYYAETKAKHGRRECGGDGQLVEAVCHEGEVMYVPSGWWHLVVNLDDSVALTQNFVSVTELPDVLSFMKYTPDQISGFRKDMAKTSVFEQFVEKLRSYDQDLTNDALARMPSRKVRKPAEPTRDWRERLCEESETMCTFSSLVDDAELGETPW